MARIAIIASTFCKTPALVDYAKSTLKSHELKFCDGKQISGKELIEFLKESDGALVGREIIDEAVLSQLPDLQAISLYGVGFDNVDLDACAKHGVKFLHQPGVNSDAVAEFTIGLILGSLRNIAHSHQRLEKGIWQKDGGRQLTGATAAVIGCGNIGSKVAKLLRAFNCNVVLNDLDDRSVFAREIGAQTADLETCLKIADIVTVHVPLTTKTKHLFNSNTIALMKRGSLLVNTSRGSVVSMEALKEFLDNGHLAAAALDVFEFEPLNDPTVYLIPNLLKTPHIAGNAVEAVLAMGRAAVDLLNNCFYLN